MKKTWALCDCVDYDSDIARYKEALLDHLVASVHIGAARQIHGIVNGPEVRITPSTNPWMRGLPSWLSPVRHGKRRVMHRFVYRPLYADYLLGMLAIGVDVDGQRLIDRDALETGLVDTMLLGRCYTPSESRQRALQIDRELSEKALKLFATNENAHIPEKRGRRPHRVRPRSSAEKQTPASTH